MKKLVWVFASVLVSTLASAKGVDKPTPEGSSVALVNAKGSSLYKLVYKSAREQNVKISLVDGNGNSVYKETFRHTNNFIRPYNFSGIAEGDYTIRIEDENGVKTEKLTYKSEKKETWVNIAKVRDQEHKYLVQISSPEKDNVTINIYDHNGKLMYNEEKQIDKEGFAQVYNIKGIESFSIEVTDCNGVVKSISY